MRTRTMSLNGWTFGTRRRRDGRVMLGERKLPIVVKRTFNPSNEAANFALPGVDAREAAARTRRLRRRR